jgi:ADP-ribose pyrophosphatase YjhB (NUDIX family)
MSQRARGILIYRNKILVIKIEKKKKEFYTFPGGHGKKGESIKNTCKREFFEETGLNVNIIKMVHKTKEKDHDTQYYLCELDVTYKFQKDENGYPVTQLIGEELKRKSKYEPLWISISELESVDLYPSEIVGKLEDLIR